MKTVGGLRSRRAGVAGIALTAMFAVGLGVGSAVPASALPISGLASERLHEDLGPLIVPGILTTGPLVASVVSAPVGLGELYTTVRLQTFGVTVLGGKVRARTAIAQLGHVGPADELAAILPAADSQVLVGDGAWESIPWGVPALVYTQPQFQIEVFPSLGAVQAVARVPAALAPRTAVRALLTGISEHDLALITGALWPNGLPAGDSYAADDPWDGFLDDGGSAAWQGEGPGPGIGDILGPAVDVAGRSGDAPGGTTSVGTTPTTVGTTPTTIGTPWFSDPSITSSGDPRFWNDLVDGPGDGPGTGTGTQNPAVGVPGASGSPLPPDTEPAGAVGQTLPAGSNDPDPCAAAADPDYCYSVS
jgi:hypothetical protein